MRRVEVTEVAGCMTVMRSRAGAILDILPLAALFLFPALPVTVFLRLADDLQGPKALLAIALVALVVVLIVAGFLLAMRHYRRSRLDERVVLDRATGTVRVGGVARGRLDAVTGVELRRGPEPSGAARWDLALATAAGPVVVRGTPDRDEMRAHGRALADFLGVALTEPR